MGPMEGPHSPIFVPVANERRMSNAQANLASVEFSGSPGGIGEIFDCLPLAPSSRANLDTKQAVVSAGLFESPPMKHGVDEIHDAPVASSTGLA